MKSNGQAPDVAVEVAAALERYATEYMRNVEAPHFLRARKVVIDYFLTLLNKGCRVLDINCGTGIDSIEIARHGHSVKGIDISSAMISFAKESISAGELSGRVEAEVGDYRSLPKPDVLFDSVISNFGGINFAQNLDPVFASVRRNLSDGGLFLVNSVSRFSIMESLTFAIRGKIGKSVRRLSGGTARIGGTYVRLYYHSRASFLRTAELFGFRLVDSFGLNILAPPLWAEDFFRFHPKLAGILEGVDDKIRRVPLIRSAGDFMILVFRKTDGERRSNERPGGSDLPPGS